MKPKIMGVSYIAIIIVGTANLLYASRFLMPLGDDGIILMWPAGYWISHLPWRQIPKFLSASFMGEDHLSPLSYLTGYLFYLLPLRPEVAMNLADKVLFIGVIASAFAVAVTLWGNYSKALLFLAFVIPNTAMTWRIIVFYGGSGISALAVFTALYFYLQYLRTQRFRNALVFSASFFIMTLSFELSVIGLPLFAILTLHEAELSPIKNRLRLLVQNGCWLLSLYLPYFIMHYKVYGTIMPTSRLGRLSGGNPVGYILRGIAAAWSEWLFDVPKLIMRSLIGSQIWNTEMATNLIWPAFVSPLTALFGALAAIGAFATLLKYAITNQLFSWPGKLLWVALALQNMLLVYAGRFEDGMWIIVGLTFWLAVTDLVFNILAKSNYVTAGTTERKISIASLGFLGTGVLLGFIVRPFDQAQQRYLNQYLSTMAAYTAIGQDTDQFTLVRMRPSTEFFNPLAFWTGHNIFWGHPGLWYYEQENTTYFRNMAIQTYTDSNPNAFVELLPRMKRTPQNHEVLLFEDLNLFFRIFLDSTNSHISRAIPVSGSKPQTFSIHLPYADPYQGTPKHLRYVLTFDQPLSGPQKIMLSGNLIQNYSFVDGTKLEFPSENMGGGELQLISSNAALTQIDVYEILDGNDEEPSALESNSHIVLSSPSATLCGFGLSSDAGESFVGSLDAGTLLSFNPLLPGKFKGDYSSINANRNLRISGPIKFDSSTNSGPIVICP